MNVLTMNVLAKSLFIAALLVSIALAHHSHNSFDEGTLVELSGIVEEINYRNPHIEIVLRVGVDDPETEEVESVLWEIDTVSATGANRHKLYRDTIEEGDPLRAYGWPLSNGEPVIYGGRLVMFEDPEAAIEAEQSFIREELSEGFVVVESVEDGKTIIPLDEVVIETSNDEASRNEVSRDESADDDLSAESEVQEANFSTRTFMFRQTLW